MYTAHFGLERAPFSGAPNADFFCQTTSHRDAVAQLASGVRTGGGVVVLTGEAGVGKTMVAREFMRQLPDQCELACLFDPPLSVAEQLLAVCEDFGIRLPLDLDPVSMVDWVARLKCFLLSARAQGRLCLLVVDEAHRLGPQGLAPLLLLAELETGGIRLLQIVLIGRPSLDHLLAEPQLDRFARAVALRCHLGPLSLADSQLYLRHRLHVGGLRGPSPIAPRLVPVVRQLSGGVPRRINEVCDRALRVAFHRGRFAVNRSCLLHAGKLLGTGGIPSTRLGWRWLWVLWPLVAALVLTGLRVRADAAAKSPVDRSAMLTLPAGATPAGAELRQAEAIRSSAGHTPVPASVDRAEFDRLLATALSEPAGLQALALRWGVTASNVAGCAAIRRERELACFESRGGLTLLHQLDRPALLRVSANQGAKRVSLLLIGMAPGQVILEHKGRRLSVPLAWLAEVWEGEFITLWRAPTVHPGGVPLVVSGALAGWLQARLPASDSQVAARVAPTDLASRLARFQMSLGLKPDGKPGPATMMALNRRLGVIEPKLENSLPQVGLEILASKR